jgi:uncharacterized membrane protein
MSNHIINELPELLKNKVISEETAQNIKDYYRFENENPSSNLFLVFGIIGAILGSLGIILIFAHNWDNLSQFAKCCVSFIPLIIGQLACGFSLFKKNDSVTWTESSAGFLFFAVGASISLIAQTYNISGDFGKFILTWMLLCLPLVYIIKSNIISLLYIIGITVYCTNTNYFSYPKQENYWYWLLLLAILPHYYKLLTNYSKNNFTSIHNWAIPISISIGLGSIANDDKNNELIFFTYAFLMSCFYFISKSDLFKNNKLLTNGYAITGKIGLLYLLYMASFRWIWTSFLSKNFNYGSTITIVTILLLISSLYLLFRSLKAKKIEKIELISYAAILLFVLFFIAKISVIVPVVIINLFVVLIGIIELNRGNKENSIARMNFGILIIAILITCRFFDTNMSFIVRGILFILVGAGFFAMNYYMLKKRKIK